MNENEELIQETPDLGSAWDEEATGGQTEEAQDNGTQSAVVAGDQQQSPRASPDQIETQGFDLERTSNETERMPAVRRTERSGVCEDEVQLAQKGMDYDRIRTERDQLRQYREEAGPALSFLKGYAEKNGMTVEEYIDYCRKQELLGQGVSEETATAQVELEKRQAALDARDKAERESRERQEAQERQVQERQAAQRRDMEAFLASYPGVKGEDIPQEVWAQVAQGKSLVTAYAEHENRQLKAELAAERQNRENAARTPGSMSTQGEKNGHTISDFWDEAGE